jgi:hypothetical protein
VIIPEAEKSSLAIMAAGARAERRVLAVGCGGCWSWRGRIGKTEDASGARVDETGVLPDLDRITWTNRDTIILFDTNAATNAKVQAARRALAGELAKRGAKVRIADLPPEDGINGPDDYIGKHGDVALFAVIDSAQPAAKGTKPRKSKTDAAGRAVQLDDPDPWPDGVDGGQLLLALTNLLLAYLVLPQCAALAIALWLVHTYTFDTAWISPLLG